MQVLDQQISLQKQKKQEEIMSIPWANGLALQWDEVHQQRGETKQYSEL